MFLNDTFTGADTTTLASHTGEKGATWAVDSNFAGSVIQLTNANRARVNVGGTISYYCSGRPASADYYVETVLYVASVITGIRVGVSGRLVPGVGSGYVAMYENWAGAARWEIRDASFTLFGFYNQVLTPGQSYTLRLDMVGTTIRLLVDGVERISITDSTYPLAGRAGLYGFGTTTNTTGLHYESITSTSVRAAANNIVCDGDSITAGTGTNTLPWPTQLATALGSTYLVRNVGVSGKQVSELTTDAATGVDPKFSEDFDRNLCVLFGGTNDIYFNADASDAGSTTISNIAAYCAARQAVGWTVVVVTILPRGGDFSTSTLPATKATHFNARRAAVNTSVRANYLTYANALADVAINATIGDDGDDANTTYYQDNIHPTNAGATVIEGIILAALVAAGYVSLGTGRPPVIGGGYY